MITFWVGGVPINPVASEHDFNYEPEFADFSSFNKTFLQAVGDTVILDLLFKNTGNLPATQLALVGVIPTELQPAIGRPGQLLFSSDSANPHGSVYGFVEDEGVYIYHNVQLASSYQFIQGQIIWRRARQV